MKIPIGRYIKCLCLLYVVFTYPLSAASLTWTAPGDDGNVGTATEYDLRISDVYHMPDPTFTVFYIDTVGWKDRLDIKRICPPGEACIITLMYWGGLGPDPNYCMRGHGYIDTTHVPAPILDTVIVSTFQSDKDIKNFKKWRVRQ